MLCTGGRFWSSAVQTQAKGTLIEGSLSHIVRKSDGITCQWNRRPHYCCQPIGVGSLWSCTSSYTSLVLLVGPACCCTVADKICAQSLRFLVILLFLALILDKDCPCRAWKHQCSWRCCSHVLAIFVWSFSQSSRTCVCLCFWFSLATLPNWPSSTVCASQTHVCLSNQERLDMMCSTEWSYLQMLDCQLNPNVQPPNHGFVPRIHIPNSPPRTCVGGLRRRHGATARWLEHRPSLEEPTTLQRHHPLRRDEDSSAIATSESGVLQMCNIQQEKARLCSSENSNLRNQGFIG